MKNDAPLRKIKTLEFCQSKYSPMGSGSARLELSCGHTVYRKWSQCPSNRARCRPCKWGWEPDEATVEV